MMMDYMFSGNISRIKTENTAQLQIAISLENNTFSKIFPAC